MRRTDGWRGARREASRVASAVLLTLLAGCAGGRVSRISPADIPQLEAQLTQAPNNATLRSRYAAALFAADRCDDATAEARRVQSTLPADAVAALVIGQCQERREQLGDALTTYRAFLAANPNARGAAAIRARELLAFRAYSTQQARLALQNEAQLGQQAGDPNTIAVLPLEIAGDSSYQSLSRGLAQILTSDLALIRRFRLVERLQLGVLLDELQLAQGGRVDVSTAARVGRMVQAGRMVQGLAAIPPQGEVRLEATVVLPTGEVTSPEAVTGRFRDLLRMEKNLVVQISSRLGYQLSEAERRTILENGTQNLTAFLAYSRGLVSEDAGDYSRAAQYFSQAVRADPGFQQAREQYQATVVADAVQEASANEITATAQQEAPSPEPPAPPPTDGQLNSGVKEVAATQAEKNEAPAPAAPVTGTTAAGTPAADPNKTTTNSGTSNTVSGTIRIVFRLP